jgi:hypothetical protein
MFPLDSQSQFFLVPNLNPLAATNEPQTMTTPQIILFKSGKVRNRIIENTIDHAEYVMLSAMDLDAPIVAIAL